MDISAKKLELIQLLLQEQKETVLLKIETIFKKEEKDWWLDLSDDEKASINRGIDDAENGRVKSNQEVMSKFKKWH